MTVNIMSEYYTLGEAARHLSVNRMTLGRWLKRGKIEAYRVGRETIFPKWEIELLKEQRNRKKGK